MPKALLFCTSAVDPSAAAATHGWPRYQRWIEYYSARLDALGADAACLINDGSVSEAPVDIYDATALPETLPSGAAIIRFPTRLGRPALFDYPGWWRSFCFSQQLARQYGYRKLIHIESDFFVLSSALIDYIASLSSGWTALFSRYYQIPETGIQVICGDSLDRMESVRQAVEATGLRFPAEHVLPFTTIERRFVGDRFGEAQVYDGWRRHFGFPLYPLDYIGDVESADVLAKCRSTFQFVAPW